MPTIVRKSGSVLVDLRREIVQAVSWQVHAGIWSPPTDFYETEDALIVRVEIAGMREEDFDVILEKDTLFISGSRPDLAERRAYHQMEIRFGKFTTAVALPVTVNVDEARAEYKDGFLTVTIPKQSSSQEKGE